MMNKSNDKAFSGSMKRSSKSDVKEKKKQQKVKTNADKKIEKLKKEKYSTVSSQMVFKDMKNTAVRGFNGVRTTFDNLSQRFKSGAAHDQSNASLCNGYQDLSAAITPIRLYSPFGIETPSPRIDRRHLRRSCRRQMFFSPTQKIKEDVMYLNNGLKELNLISEDIENRFPVSDSNESQVYRHVEQSLI